MKLCSIALLLMSLLGAAAAIGAENRPNIVVILADDLGVETVGAYGGQSYATPRIDRLAEEGVRFSNAHAQPLCTPSRVQLMTGRYNFRNYQHFMYLDPAEPVFSQALQAAGYRTLVAGKWQLVNNRAQDRAARGAVPTARQPCRSPRHSIHRTHLPGHRPPRQARRRRGTVPGGMAGGAKPQRPAAGSDAR